MWLVALHGHHLGHCTVADIQTATVNRIDADRGVGIVAGLLTADGRRRDAAHGVADTTSETLVTSHTLFEVGSLTKLFTALLLADVVERGEVGLDDPISRYLPARVAAPTRQFTLIDLATHPSGLPGNPTNLARPGIEGGCATYDIQIGRLLPEGFLGAAEEVVEERRNRERHRVGIEGRC